MVQPLTLLSESALKKISLYYLERWATEMQMGLNVVTYKLLHVHGNCADI
jgi:hypothetical protein